MRNAKIAKRRELGERISAQALTFLAIAFTACTTAPESEPSQPEPVSSTDAQTPGIILTPGPVCELIGCDAERFEIVYGPLRGELDVSEVDPAISRLADIGDFCEITGAVVTGKATQAGHDAAVERYVRAVTERLSRDVPEDGIIVASGVRIESRIGGLEPPEPLAMVEVSLVSRHPNPDCR